MWTQIFALLALASPLLSEESDHDCTCCSETYYSQLVEGNKSAYFQVPGDWLLAKPDQLPPKVTMLATGEGKREVRPRLNLAEENVDGDLDDYLKVIAELNKAEGREWRKLGTIETESGTASLSQCDMPTKWGTTRMLHAILVQNKKAYILTASSLQEEFADNYELFFRSLSSLKVPAQQTL